ncbi:MAG: hypothetical protein HY900_24625 [Deltaproteobacteria bacterium]|nr:hypothetical protein [Deltaproteobacteria bacterium]
MTRFASDRYRRPSLLALVVAVLTAAAQLAIPRLGWSETTVPGGVITCDTTWTRAGSPYIVTGDVTVSGTAANAPPAVLTIEPGVEVRFRAGVRLNIGRKYYGPWYGLLVAKGTGRVRLRPRLSSTPSTAVTVYCRSSPA